MPPLTKTERRENNEAIKETKDALRKLLSDNMELVRTVRDEFKADKNVVCIFDSDLTRSLHLSEDKLNDDIIIIKVYYYEVAENIIKNGFYMNGEKYVFFSASAGQIRTKKFVAVKETALAECMDRLTCGLSLESINAQGGVNVNKYLAYLALCNSATDVWEDFDIDKCIVVDDFETNVRGLVDYITVEDGSIKRQEMDVPITHTDGCGMVLPSVSKKNFMVRAPWIKGLLASFPFDKFIREANRRDSTVNHGIIKDIYGVEHDVLAEGIQVVLTASQFKMHKYFQNFEQYKENFKRFGCTAGKCKVEEDYVPNAQFNYQMLQTLTDMTDEELEELAEATNQKIRGVTSDRNTMLRLFGATKWDRREDPFQECLYIYPELLQDAYCVESLRSIKNKLVKDGRGARLDVKGKYLFLLPDLYAACEHWFLGEEVPKGLLADGEVYCRVYPNEPKIDVLRSPHLFREHTVRRNTFQDDAEKKRWFATDAVYTSSWDLITKIIMADFDGDTGLACVEPTIIKVAERLSKDIVPLLYTLSKAPAHMVTPDLMWQGMKNAYDGGRIGPISNKISKIWNSTEPDLDAIKMLCAENNITIDYAKTLYKPEWPAEAVERMNAATSGKVPHFFVYAKGKTAKQVESANGSVVNRLERIIKAPNLRFETKTLGKFDYRMLMHDKNTEIREADLRIIETFVEISKNCGYRLSEDDSDKNNHNYVYQQTRDSLLDIDKDIYHVVDILILQMFGIQSTKRKSMFWGCFGDVVLENIRKNIDTNTILCSRCGKRIKPMSHRQEMCDECAAEQERLKNRDRVRKHRSRISDM